MQRQARHQEGLGLPEEEQGAAGCWSRRGPIGASFHAIQESIQRTGVEGGWGGLGWAGNDNVYVRVNGAFRNFPNPCFPGSRIRGFQFSRSPVSESIFSFSNLRFWFPESAFVFRFPTHIVQFRLRAFSVSNALLTRPWGAEAALVLRIYWMLHHSTGSSPKTWLRGVR